MQFGDRIIALDDVTISSRSEIASLLRDHKIGDTVTLTVSRVDAANSTNRRVKRVQVDVEITLVEAQPAVSSNSDQ